MPVLTINMLALSSLAASENVAATNTQKMLVTKKAMPAPPAGPYRSTKYYSTNTSKPTTVDTRQWTMPTPMNWNQQLTKNRRENKLPNNNFSRNSQPVNSASASQAPVAPKIAIQQAIPQSVPQPVPYQAPPLNPRFKRGFMSAPNHSQWRPPVPQQQGQAQRQFVPPYPVQPRLRQAPPGAKFNNRRWMPSPPPPWVQRRGYRPPPGNFNTAPKFSRKPYQPMPPRYPVKRNIYRSPVWQNNMPPQYRRW